MQTALDQTISNLALEGSSLKEIADQLNNTQHNEDYCAFLFTSGLYKYLFQYLIERLKKDLPVPWKYLFALIKRGQISLDKEVMTQFFLQNNPDPALLSNSSCLESPELLTLRNEHLDQHYKQSAQLNIEKELQIVRSQKLLKKEGELIQDLIQLDEKNPFFQKQWQTYQYKKARDVFDEYKNAHQEALYAVQKHTSPEEDKILQNLVKGLNQLASQHSPQLINDIVVMLSSTGSIHLALEFLESRLDTEERKWIYLDLLLEDRQFFKCLNFVEQTFMQTQANSETAFALNYVKAQAYYGLKEYDKAQAILQDLVSLRPQYRSAKALLSQWKSEEEL